MTHIRDTRLLAVLGLAAAALLVTVVSAASVVPERVPQAGGNEDPCPAGTTRLHAELGELDAGSVSDSTVEIAFDDVYAAGAEPADDASAFDWSLRTAGFTVAFVLVMDGEDGGNTYDYRPAGARTDESLTTPGPEQGEFTFKNIGYVDFCYMELEAETAELEALTAEKDAAGTFGRTITWTLAKSVDPASHEGMAGDAFGSTWTVVATKTVVEDAFAVTGTITISNPNEIDVSVEVDDVLDDASATVGTVTCPDGDDATVDDNTGTVPANGDLTCTYTASPTDASATLNTAEVTSLTEGVDGATASAEVEWTPNQIGDEQVTLEDPRFGFSEVISETATRTFAEQFACSAEGTVAHTNTAALTGASTALSASATVTITCEGIQRPSISVQQVAISSAARGSANVSGWFTIKNMSGGEATLVTLNQVTVSFVSRADGGVAANYSATCSFSPNPNGYTLQPHEAATFSYDCSLSGALSSDVNELTAVVTVGTATNQLGEVRGPFHNTSPTFKLD